MTPPLVVDVKQGAAVVGVSDWVMRRFIQDGLIPTVTYPSAKHPGKRSRRVLLAMADLQQFVAAHRAER